MTSRQTKALIAMLGAQFSICIGAIYAKALFRSVNPANVTILRLTIAAILMALPYRLWKRPLQRSHIKLILAYGVALGFMNLLFYYALKQLPLGIAICCEFMGPLCVALAGSRHIKDIIWAALALAGLLCLLPLHGTHAVSISGILFALGAGLCWALYIIFGKRAGSKIGSATSAWGMVIGTMAILPFGLHAPGIARAHPAILTSAFIIALFSSAIPYSLEIFALKALPTKTFGILTSMEPVMGAIIGLVTIKETLTLSQWGGICLIMASSIGTTLTTPQLEPHP